MRSEREAAKEARPAIRKGADAESNAEPGGWLPPRGGEASPAEKAESGGAEAGGGGGGAERSLPDLRPSEDLLRRAVGGGSVDKIDGAESGDFTALNTVQWKFASFFNRMKRQVAQNWHPDRAYLRRDPTGKVYGSKDRITVLQVSLKPDGALAHVVIERPCGVGFLDEEAVQAFKLAQPFPNPPAGLLGDKDLITFSFGFHFQIGQPPANWKIFRQK